MNQLTVVEQKKVNFNGSTLLAVQTNTGKIYAGVNIVCNSLKIDARSQRERIVEHETLSKGCAILPIPSSGGIQDTFVIELDFLPLWLVTINPKQVSENVKENLIEYQLKAKDVLAQAFLPQQTFNHSNLSKELQAIILLDKRYQEFDLRLDHLENNMTIDHGQKRSLQKLARTRVLGLLGGKTSPAYRDSSLRGATFSALWNDYKDYFNIEAYGDTLKTDFERAKQYIARWAPHGKVLRDIEEATQQISFN